MLEGTLTQEKLGTSQDK